MSEKIKLAKEIVKTMRRCLSDDRIHMNVVEKAKIDRLKELGFDLAKARKLAQEIFSPAKPEKEKKKKDDEKRRSDLLTF